MSEAEHIAAIAHATLRYKSSQRATDRRAQERTEAIQAGRIAGVSPRAIAIAADVNESRVEEIVRTGRRRKPEVVVPLGIHAVNARTPCHDQPVRFRREEVIDPEIATTRMCSQCGTKYIVRRQVIASTSRGRVDELLWEATQ